MDGLNMRNWCYYEPSHKGHLGLQLMSSVAERDEKSFLAGREHTAMVNANGTYSGAPVHMDFFRGSRLNPGEGVLHMFPGNPNFSVLSESSGTHPMQILQPPDALKEERMAMGMDHLVVKKEDGPMKKRRILNMLPGNPNFSVLPGPSDTHTVHILQSPAALKDERMGMGMGMGDLVVKKEDGSMKKRPGSATSKTPKLKKLKKARSMPKEYGNSSAQSTKSSRKNIVFAINGIDMDISSIPVPVCSCTNTLQQCYRWGCGGWQSACCTTTISMHPLPMSTKRRGARIAGRKMSQGAFKKVLEKLAGQGYNFANPIDLRSHWARHGTNKFVTIK